MGNNVGQRGSHLVDAVHAHHLRPHGGGMRESLAVPTEVFPHMRKSRATEQLFKESGMGQERLNPFPKRNFGMKTWARFG